jgi:hypothetical protein
MGGVRPADCAMPRLPRLHAPRGTMHMVARAKTLFQFTVQPGAKINDRESQWVSQPAFGGPSFQNAIIHSIGDMKSFLCLNKG